MSTMKQGFVILFEEHGEVQYCPVLANDIDSAKVSFYDQHEDHHKIVSVLTMQQIQKFRTDIVQLALKHNLVVSI